MTPSSLVVKQPALKCGDLVHFRTISTAVPKAVKQFVRSLSRRRVNCMSHLQICPIILCTGINIVKVSSRYYKV